MKKETFVKSCKYDIFNFISLCKNLRNEHNDKIFEIHETKEGFIKFSEKMVRNTQKVECFNEVNRPYIFFDVFITSYLNYLDEIVISEKLNSNNRALVTLLYSAIKKYEVIINLLENDEYENGLIIFRSLYENLIILQFLQNYKECINDFEKYSVYKISKLSKNIFDEHLKKEENKDIKYQFNINKMNKEYGWTDTVIKKERIKFYNLVEIIFKDDPVLLNKMGDMYNIISDLVHSNTCALNDVLFNDLLHEKLLLYISIFGIPMIKNNFYLLFNESFDGRFSFEMEIFLEIFEYILFQNKSNVI